MHVVVLRIIVPMYGFAGLKPRPTLNPSHYQARLNQRPFPRFGGQICKPRKISGCALQGARRCAVKGVTYQSPPKKQEAYRLSHQLERGVCAAHSPTRSLGEYPSKSNRKDALSFSPYLYRARNLVERFFNKIKQCRRVATRYDKLAANYLAFIQLASIRLWLLRINESTP
jgi:Transposase DDE domain